MFFLKILTQEDWHEVLYVGMAKTTPWAALYFILLMTFGNYVLFNLLVAILVEGFSSQAEVTMQKKFNSILKNIVYFVYCNCQATKYIDILLQF